MLGGTGVEAGAERARGRRGRRGRMSNIPGRRVELSTDLLSLYGYLYFKARFTVSLDLTGLLPSTEWPR